MTRIRAFGVAMDCTTMDEAVTEIMARVRRGDFTQQVVVNVAKVVACQRDRNLRQAIQACHLIHVDGMGVVWGLRMLGFSGCERVAGIDLFQRLLAAAEENRHPVFLLGAEQAVLEQAVENIRTRHPDLPIAGWHHGYFWQHEEQIVEQIHRSGARLLFVAVPTPQKETFINRWRERLGVDFVMGVGGSFDVLAGKTRRAPVWMQRAGMEWFFRVMQEPRRMWKRYLVTNLGFFFLVLSEACKISAKRRGLVADEENSHR